MSKDRQTIGIDGNALPILPPERDGRVWAKLVRVMFFTPGFLALLLIKTGEPTGFGISVELLMLASISAIVAGLFIGANSSEMGSDHSSRVGIWSGALVMELLSVVPILCAIPSLFHELVHSRLLHSMVSGVAAAAPAASATGVSLGASELLPAVAILPFVLYQLAGFGTLHFVVSKAANWVINIGILVLIVVATTANRQGNFNLEKISVSVLIIGMAITVVYGVLQLRQMQVTYDENCPQKAPKAAKQGEPD